MIERLIMTSYTEVSALVSIC